MTTAYKIPAAMRRQFFDPCLEMRPTNGSTMGLVTNVVAGDPFDSIVIQFRGQTLQAKGAHPEISLCQLVNVFD